MADLRLTKLTKSYTLSGGERIPISQPSEDFNGLQATLYMSPSSLNAYMNKAIVPVGTIWPYAGVVNTTTKPLPDGWLFCDGSELSTTLYRDLFLILGEVYGTSTTPGMFKLPDMRCRFVLGFNSTNPTYKPSFGGFNQSPLELGQLGGVFTHTLTQSEMAMHTHDCTVSTSYIKLLSYPGKQVEQQQRGNPNSFSGNIFPDLDLASTPTGGDMHHNTTPPFVAMHYIIKY